MHRWQALAVAAAAVVGVAAVGFAYRDEASTEQQLELTAAQDAVSPAYSFTVQAAPVEGLYPGAVRQLRLTLHNPYDFDLHVTDLHADLVGTSKAGCDPVATNLEVQPYNGNLPVEVRAEDSTEAGVVPLHMPNSVANDCQLAVFTIKLSADALRAAR